MPKSFERDIRAAAEDARRMAELVEDAVQLGVRSLRDRDRQAAEAVLAGDDAIDRLENAVAEQCCRVLALHQPMGSNLRRVVALLQVAADLERMGDLACSVAERAVRLLDFPPLAVPDRLAPMADRVVGMVHAGLDAFLNEDPALAREVRDRDVEVDEDNDAIIAELIGRMKESADQIEPALSLFSAVRHLERIADHATNVAEDAVFLVEGQIIRHRHPTPAAAGGV